MLKETFKVRHYELTAKSVLPPWSLQNFFQEAACIDADNMGCGCIVFRPKNLAWVLTKLQFEFIEPNIKRQNITVRTWACSADKIVTRRDFIIYDENDKVVAKGSSQWVIIDLLARKLVRTPQFVLDAHTNLNPEVALDQNFIRPHRLTGEETPLTTFNIQTRLEDIDINGHVNNMHFTSWALEGTPKEITDKLSLKSMVVHFKTEVRLEDEITVRTFQATEGPNSFWHFLIRKDGKEIAAVYSAWI